MRVPQIRSATIAILLFLITTGIASASYPTPSFAAPFNTYTNAYLINNINPYYTDIYSNSVTSWQANAVANFTAFSIPISNHFTYMKVGGFSQDGVFLGNVSLGQIPSANSLNQTFIIPEWTTTGQIYSYAILYTNPIAPANYSGITIPGQKEILNNTIIQSLNFTNPAGTLQFESLANVGTSCAGFFSGLPQTYWCFIYKDTIPSLIIANTSNSIIVYSTQGRDSVEINTFNQSNQYCMQTAGSPQATICNPILNSSSMKALIGNPQEFYTYISGRQVNLNSTTNYVYPDVLIDGIIDAFQLQNEFSPYQAADPNGIGLNNFGLKVRITFNTTNHALITIIPAFSTSNIIFIGNQTPSLNATFPYYANITDINWTMRQRNYFNGSIFVNGTMNDTLKTQWLYVKLPHYSVLDASPAYPCGDVQARAFEGGIDAGIVQVGLSQYNKSYCGYVLPNVSSDGASNYQDLRLYFGAKVTVGMINYTTTSQYQTTYPASPTSIAKSYTLTQQLPYIVDFSLGFQPANTVFGGGNINIFASGNLQKAGYLHADTHTFQYSPNSAYSQRFLFLPDTSYSGTYFQNNLDGAYFEVRSQTSTSVWYENMTAQTSIGGTTSGTSFNYFLTLSNSDNATLKQVYTDNFNLSLAYSVVNSSSIISPIFPLNVSKTQGVTPLPINITGNVNITSNGIVSTNNGLIDLASLNKNIDLFNVFGVPFYFAEFLGIILMLMAMIVLHTADDSIILGILGIAIVASGAIKQFDLTILIIIIIVFFTIGEFVLSKRKRG